MQVESLKKGEALFILSQPSWKRARRNRQIEFRINQESFGKQT